MGTTRRRALDVLGQPGARARAVARVEGRPAALDLGLVLTHACNLACVYCYTGDKKRVRMDAEVARRAVELGFDAAGLPGDELQLTFFGGEPLLETELLVAIAEDARRRAERGGGRLLLQVTTNGTLLTRELADRLGELGVHVALSLDGTREQHEAGRPGAGGASSYAAARAALELLVAARRPFDVVSVVDPCNVRDLGRGVRELVDAGVDSITLNPNWGARWDGELLSIFDRQLDEVGAVFVASLRRGRYVRIQPLEGALQRLAAEAAGSVGGSDACHAGGRRLAVAPSGRIYPCPRAVGEDTGRGAIGHVDAGLPPAPAASVRCPCASAEETGDPAIAGPVQEHHDGAALALARRVSSVLAAEYATVEVVERSEERGHAIPY